MSPISRRAVLHIERRLAAEHELIVEIVAGGIAAAVVGEVQHVVPAVDQPIHAAAAVHHIRDLDPHLEPFENPVAQIHREHGRLPIQRDGIVGWIAAAGKVIGRLADDPHLRGSMRQQAAAAETRQTQ